MEAAIHPPTERSDPRLLELIGTLSLATDLAMGQPMESGLGTCLVATRLGETLGLGEDELRDVYYLSLLQHIGCTVMNHELAAIVGDELAMRAGAAAIDLADPEVATPYLLGLLSATFPGLTPPQALERARAAGEFIVEGVSPVCEVAQMLGERLGFDERVRSGLGMVYERWDGTGFPGGARGGELSVPTQVVQVAGGARALYDAGGLDAVLDALPSPSAPGTPQRSEPASFATPRSCSRSWRQARAGTRSSRSSRGFRAPCRRSGSTASFGRSPNSSTSSPRIWWVTRPGLPDLASEAARRAGLPEEDALWLRRAGWVHDLGRVAISASIWGKPDPLSVAEWEQVRLHAYYTDRMLARVSWRPDMFVLATMHHERMNGSGYFRGTNASAQPNAARLLAAADTYQAMTEPRPHRAPLERKQAADELAREVRAGRIDAEAAEAVLEAAGERKRRRRTYVAGLTTREVEVLRLIARGLSTREIAMALTISPKTADKHTENIYMKAGVSSRAAATMFAMGHDLI